MSLPPTKEVPHLIADLLLAGGAKLFGGKGLQKGARGWGQEGWGKGGGVKGAKQLEH